MTTKNLLPRERIYHGEWSELADMLLGFDNTEDVIHTMKHGYYEVVYAEYDGGSYDGWCYVLLYCPYPQASPRFFEVESSHCSCYGLTWAQPSGGGLSLTQMLARTDIPDGAIKNLRDIFISGVEA